jgi:hypothetical protein
MLHHRSETVVKGTPALESEKSYDQTPSIRSSSALLENFYHRHLDKYNAGRESTQELKDIKF